MLTAHANTTAEDFIAQLRTYVIAMGLNSRVVDCVDNLMGVDEEVSSEKLYEAEGTGRVDMKNEILAAVRAWAADNLDEQQTESLIDLISEAEV
jgi:hypothetical protein